MDFDAERRKSFELGLSAINEVINELQSHETPRFDVLHDYIIKLKTIFDSLSYPDEYAVSSIGMVVIKLCDLFKNEHSLEETIERLFKECESLLCRYQDFSFITNPENFWYDENGVCHVKYSNIRKQKELKRVIPNIERHSFLK